MKINKKIALLLSAVLIGSQLAGCSKTKESKDESQDKAVESAVFQDTIEEEVVEEEKPSLLEEVSPKLSTLEGIEEVKKEINSKFTEILTNNNFKIDYTTPNNGFVVSDSPYNKYTKDYEQILYSSIGEDFSEGTVELTIYAKKEFHKQDVLDQSDDFIKCIYDLYIYTSNIDMSFEEFYKKIDSAMIDYSSVDLEDNPANDNINIVVDSYSSSTTLEFKLSKLVEDTVKRKYYKKQYDTVENYKNDTALMQNMIEETVEKYHVPGSYNLEDNMHKVLEGRINLDENKFMQDGTVIISGGKSTIYNQAPKIGESEFNELDAIFKRFLGESLINKVNISQFNLENLNKALESQMVINTFSDRYSIPDVDIYIDNASIEFSELGDFIKPSEEEDYSSNHYCQLSLYLLAPVIAEGISEI